MAKSKAMVEQLRRCGVFHSEKVAEVMETIDRGLFVPAGTPAYMDSPMPIGHNATISAPHMHAMCLDLLNDNLQPGMHALDVGSGDFLYLCLFMESLLLLFQYILFQYKVMNDRNDTDMLVCLFCMQCLVWFSMQCNLHEKAT